MVISILLFDCLLRRLHRKLSCRLLSLSQQDYQQYQKYHSILASYAILFEKYVRRSLSDDQYLSWPL